MVSLEHLTWKFLPKYFLLGDVAYRSSVPSGRTLYIDTGIYWILALEPSLCALQMVAWFPLVPGSLNDGLSVLLGPLLLTTMSYSEDCGRYFC